MFALQSRLHTFPRNLATDVGDIITDMGVRVVQVDVTPTQCPARMDVDCPAGSHHDPLLVATFSIDQCLACPVGTSCPHGAKAPVATLGAALWGQPAAV